MQNWEVVKKKISEMNKDKFIGFIGKACALNTREIAEMCDVKQFCLEEELCQDENWGCEDCLKVLLNKKYQPPKQEKWIVHRTLRKSGGRETYVSLDRTGYGLRNYDTPFNHYELYSHTDRKQAKGFSKEEAIHIRDILNEKRVGKRYLWVISKVED